MADDRSDVLGHARRLARFLHRVLYWRISDVVAPSRLGRVQPAPKAGGEIMRLLSIGLLCLFLAGCTASAKDDAKCRSYGSSPGESAYVQCRATLDSARTVSESMAR